MKVSKQPGGTKQVGESDRPENRGNGESGPRRLFREQRMLESWCVRRTQVAEAVYSPRLIRFGIFEVDLDSGELRKSGQKLKLTGQPFQVLVILLEHAGRVVTREELQKRLWPETFVDVNHNLNTAINKIREVLGDSAENPRFIETLPRRGYRFMGRVGVAEGSAQAALDDPRPVTRSLTRLTFDAGLQLGVTWSPDGRFIAYSSDRGGSKFDIWVQPVSDGDAVQVTKGSGHNWQPDWSPDGKLIAFRSERAEGGLYVVPALGGPERKIASFGYRPRWSPDGSQILFGTSFSPALASVQLNRLYLVGLSASPPREVLAEFLARHDIRPFAAAWHPGGKRISVGTLARGAGPIFWTVPVDGGPAIKTEIAPDAANQIGEANRSCGSPYDCEFSWAPSGKSVCFQRRSGGAVNLWKMAIDPATLQATGVQRLTTGAGLETDFALSPDGKRLAFTAKIQYTRVWIFPFDAAHGRVTGPGQAVTSPGMVASEAHLSPDGSRLAYCVDRAGKWELREKSLADDREAPVVADDYFRLHPAWSPHSGQLAYMRADPHTGRAQLFVWSLESRNEEPLTKSEDKLGGGIPYDWSPDGQCVLISRKTRNDDPTLGVWLVPIPTTGHTEEARKMASDPDYSLYQAHFSPDGRWMVFEATKNGLSAPESTLRVMPTSGGPWIPLTSGKYWQDKPRWSPDGRIIYFLSGRGEFFDVWGIRFDPVDGRPIGEPFCVTSFESPGLRVSEPISLAGLSVTQDRLALTLTEVSGSIWMLDNVDR
jgi:Tol biopolymer transport system component